MLINTQYFGQLNVADDHVIQFQNGLKGFEDKKKYAIIKNYDTEEPVPFFWLQSLDDPELAFVITVPFIFNPNYSFELPLAAEKTLHINEKSELGVYSIVTISNKVKDFTYNLQSPIVVNYDTKEAEQVVLYDENFSPREKYTL